MTNARRGLGRLVSALSALLLLGLLATHLVWLAEIASLRGDDPGAAAASADGIVVLTGGADRVATALRLQAERRGPILLVSGVGGSADLAAVVHRSGAGVPADDPDLAGRVTLGRAAASTHGNALETAAWARDHGVRRLLVVTTDYHMPRALTELSRALPDVILLPIPVQPPSLQGWARWRRLADEYAKWLVAKAGLSGYSDQHEAREAAPPPDLG